MHKIYLGSADFKVKACRQETDIFGGMLRRFPG